MDADHDKKSGTNTSILDSPLSENLMHHSFRSCFWAGQNAINASSFENESIFLCDDQESRVNLLHYPDISAWSDDHSYIEWHGRDSDLSTLRTRDGHTESVADCSQVSDSHADCDDVSTTESKAFTWTLRSVTDVERFFVSQRTGLVILKIEKEHSWARIGVTREVFGSLIKNANIFPAIKDTILYFGFRSNEVEIAPPRPRVNLLHAAIGDPTASSSEISYGLRFIERKPSNSGGHTWVLRQCVVYNRTHYEQRSSTWLFMTIPEVLDTQLNAFINEHGSQTMLKQFLVHAFIISVLLPMWRPYLADVTTEIDGYVLQICMAQPDGQGSVKLEGTLLRTLMDLENTLLDVQLAINAVKSTIQTLENLLKTIGFWEQETQQTDGSDPLITITSTFYERREDADAYMRQTAALLSKLRSCSRTLSSFLSLESSYALKTLTNQARDENAEMAKLTRIATDDAQHMARLTELTIQDAKAVKAIAIITMIFLPITVVLNFFSTSFIDTSDGAMHVVGGWWLFLAVGLPMTVLVLMAWWFWTRWHPRGNNDRDKCKAKGRIESHDHGQIHDAEKGRCPQL